MTTLWLGLCLTIMDSLASQELVERTWTESWIFTIGNAKSPDWAQAYQGKLI